MNAWPIAISVLTFILGLGLGFGYWTLRVSNSMMPMMIDLAPKMMALYEKDEQGFVLVGQRSMIGAIKHQIEAHGLVHKDDVLTWLAETDKKLEAESRRRGEVVGAEARRQYDAEHREDSV